MTYHRLPTVPTSTNIDIVTLRLDVPIVNTEEEDMVYWYSTSVRNHEHRLAVIETSHFLSLDIAAEPHVSKDFWKACGLEGLWTWTKGKRCGKTEETDVLNSLQRKL